MAIRTIDDAKLNDIAVAIQQKSGDSEQMTVDEMPQRIAAISTSETKIEEKDVNFYDTFGDLHYSYTAEEALSLTELPPLPEKEGFTTEGWNWTLDAIKEAVNETGQCDVGTGYTHNDGTLIEIEIDDSNYTNIMMNLVFKNITIDWGDGSPAENYEGLSEALTTSPNMISHQYDSIGRYKIKIDGKFHTQYNPGGTLLFDGVSYDSVDTKKYQSFLKNVYFGSSVVWGLSCLAYANVENISSFKKSRISISNLNYHGKVIILYNEAGDNAFSRNMKYVNAYKIIFPSEYSNKYSGYCQFFNVKRVQLNNCGLYNNIAFSNNNFLDSILKLNDIFETVSFSDSSKDNDSYSGLSKIIYGKNLKNLTISILYSPSLSIHDFSKVQVVPALTSASYFISADAPSKYCIIVPDHLYEEWINATNWSSISDHIVKSSEVNET